MHAHPHVCVVCGALGEDDMCVMLGALWWLKWRAYRELIRPTDLEGVRYDFFEVLGGFDFKELFRFEKPHFVRLLAALELPAELEISRSEREHTPKKHHEDDGYVGVVGGRQVPSGSRVKGGSGRSFTSPLNLASSQESAPSQGGSGGAGASGGVEEDGSAAGDRKKGKGKSRSKATEGGTSTQGGSKLFTRDGEKTALHLLVQEHCPTRYDERKGAAAAWQSIYKKLRDNRITLTLKDKTGKTREVVVDMGPKMEGRSEKEVVKKLKDKWDADRRAEKGKDKDDAKKTGEGTTDADEVEETTEDVEQRNAYHAWEAGKSDKKAAKSMKADHREKGEKIRDDAEEGFNSRLGGGGALGGGSSSGKTEGRGRRGARSRGHGNGKGKSRQKRKGTGKRRRVEELSYQQQMERHAYQGTGIFSGSEGSDGDSDESESTSQDEGAKTRRLDAQETDLASGRGGRATREGKGGGIRRRKVPPLSQGGGGSRGEDMLFAYLEELMEGKREERAERAAATAGGLGAGGGLTQADLASLGDTVTRSVMAALRQGGVNGAPQQFPAYPAAGLAGHHPPFPPEAPPQSYPAAGPTDHQASFPPGAPQQRSSFPYPAGTAGAGAPAVAVGVTSGAQGAGGHGGLAKGRVGGGGGTDCTDLSGFEYAGGSGRRRAWGEQGRCAD